MHFKVREQRRGTMALRLTPALGRGTQSITYHEHWSPAMLPCRAEGAHLSPPAPAGIADVETFARTLPRARSVNRSGSNLATRRNGLQGATCMRIERGLAGASGANGRVAPGALGSSHSNRTSSTLWYRNRFQRQFLNPARSMSPCSIIRAFLSSTDRCWLRFGGRRSMRCFAME